MIIAVDGPAAAGKGTLARRLAAQLGFHFLDTGLLYRMIARSLIDAGIDPSDHAAAARIAEHLDPSLHAEADLRGEAVGNAASAVAAIPAVRQALLGLQRDFAARSPGSVLDGRDIGTVVCPEADVKLFVTARPEVRARRRLLELQSLGQSPGYEEVLDAIHARDRRDAARPVSPMKPAADALVIDTSELSAGEALDMALKAVAERRPR